jgi:hypothetical protein
LFCFDQNWQHLYPIITHIQNNKLGILHFEMPLRLLA